MTYDLPETTQMSHLEPTSKPLTYKTHCSCASAALPSASVALPMALYKYAYDYDYAYIP